MKSVVFRPLRRIKKNGKITVASYAQWNRVRVADYAAFVLIVDNEYAGMPEDEHVYNHEGKPLFWRDFSPDDIPVFENTVLTSSKEFTAFLAKHAGCYAVRWHPTLYSPGTSISYACSFVGLDCEGTPAFSHYTIDAVAERYNDMSKWEPLTVGVVVKWFGWMLYQLQNSQLQIGK